MPHRKEQLESTLQRLISQVISRRIADPRIRGMVSVTSVEVSSDYHHASVHVSVMPESYEKTTLAGLQSAARHIGIEARKGVDVRIMPHLTFKIDRSLKRQAEIEAAIARGRSRDAEIVREAEPTEPASEPTEAKNASPGVEPERDPGER